LQGDDERVRSQYHRRAGGGDGQRGTDSNYSNIFSVWDQLFGTYSCRVEWSDLRYGLDGIEGERTETLRGLLALPVGG
jgi:sterol desaturase/sphingolipid hydroxylase (fatty acid hydroxylase superfamily)